MKKHVFFTIIFPLLTYNTQAFSAGSKKNTEEKEGLSTLFSKFTTTVKKDMSENKNLMATVRENDNPSLSVIFRKKDKRARAYGKSMRAPAINNTPAINNNTPLLLKDDVSNNPEIQQQILESISRQNTAAMYSASKPGAGMRQEDKDQGNLVNFNLSESYEEKAEQTFKIIVDHVIKSKELEPLRKKCAALEDTYTQEIAYIARQELLDNIKLGLPFTLEGITDAIKSEVSMAGKYALDEIKTILTEAVDEINAFKNARENPMDDNGSDEQQNLSENDHNPSTLTGIALLISKEIELNKQRMTCDSNGIHIVFPNETVCDALSSAIDETSFDQTRKNAQRMIIEKTHTIIDKYNDEMNALVLKNTQLKNEDFLNNIRIYQKNTLIKAVKDACAGMFSPEVIQNFAYKASDKIYTKEYFLDAAKKYMHFFLKKNKDLISSKKGLVDVEKIHNQILTSFDVFDANGVKQDGFLKNDCSEFTVQLKPGIKIPFEAFANISQYMVIHHPDCVTKWDGITAEYISSESENVRESENKPIISKRTYYPFLMQEKRK